VGVEDGGRVFRSRRVRRGCTRRLRSIPSPLTPGKNTPGTQQREAARHPGRDTQPNVPAEAGGRRPTAPDPGACGGDVPAPPSPADSEHPPDPFEDAWEGHPPVSQPLPVPTVAPSVATPVEMLAPAMRPLAMALAPTEAIVDCGGGGRRLLPEQHRFLASMPRPIRRRWRCPARRGGSARGIARGGRRPPLTTSLRSP